MASKKSSSIKSSKDSLPKKSSKDSLPKKSSKDSLPKKSSSRKSSRNSLSKKSSSRKSSRNSLSKKSLSATNFENIEKSKSSQPISKSTILVLLLLSITYNILLIYYLTNLEGESCDCLIDWRFHMIKYVSIFGILNGIIILGFNMYEITRNNIYITITGIIGLINLYAFFTYIGELDSSKCACAVKKQETLHKFFSAIRYIQAIIIVIAIILIILGVLAILFF
jgi:hypothetical protein